MKHRYSLLLLAPLLAFAARPAGAQPAVVLDRFDDIEENAQRVAELQRGKTTARDELDIRDIFLSTRGIELTQLKNLVDRGGDHRDLHQLVYHDIDDDQLRADILAHISEQAKTIPRQGAKLLSDIDDTVYANWKDERYPAKTVYPGVHQFYIEIDESPSAIQTTPLVTFLTARPEERTGEIEDQALESLKERGFGDATMLSGSIAHLMSNDAIAEKKHENFLRYAALFPEYRFIFVGDSGQGDAQLAMSMRRSSPDAVRGLFIHKVDAVSEAEASEWTASSIHTFDTYAGAAAAACAAGLIDQAALRRVAAATVTEMKQIRFDSDTQKAARRRDLTTDLVEVNALLAPASATPLDD